MRTSAAVAAALVLLVGQGCTGIKSHVQRKRRPHYTILPAFYASPPKCIAVLPVTPRYEDIDREDNSKAAAKAMRAGFYRHLSVKPYTDVELDDIDSALRAKGLLDDAARPGKKTLGQHVGGALPGDVTNLTRLVNPFHYVQKLGGAPQEAFGAKRFEKKPLQGLRNIVDSDAFVFGTSREYGWMYAVVFSYVKAGAKARMYSSDTGEVLWKCRGEEGSFAWVIGSPYMIPIKFVTTYLNAGSFRLDAAVDDLFRHIMRSMPYLDKPVNVEVRTVTTAPVLKDRGYSYCWWSRYGKVPQGTRMKYIVERDGWYQVETKVQGKKVVGWVFGAQAEVIDADDPTRVIRPALEGKDIFLK